MVAAEGHHRDAGSDDLRRMLLDPARDILLAAPVEKAVTIIDNGEGIEGIEEPGPVRTPGMLIGCAADRLRAETGARTVGHRLVEGDAGDGDVDAAEVTGKFAAHKGLSTGIGCLDLGTEMAVAAKGGIARQAVAVRFMLHQRLLRQHQRVAWKP